MSKLEKEFLNKIYNNYIHNSSCYNDLFKSEHWQYQNKRKFNLFKIEKLENFRNNGLSTGLDDQFYSTDDTKKLLNSLISDLSEEYVCSLLEKDNVGNVKDFLSFKDRYYSSNELFHIKYTSLLEKFYEIDQSKVICEIGPGYGSFINKLFKRKNFKAVLIDLPEANFISVYFLKMMFSDKKFLLSTDIKGKISQNIFKNYDVLVLCPWDPIDNLKIDVFINTRSMMEMNNETIKFYFKKIQKQINLNGIFFCINRYYKDTVGYPVELSKYPYDNQWEVLYSEKSWKQDHVHCLITKRILNSIEDIKKEKEKISVLSEEIRKKDKWVVRRILPNTVYVIYKKIKFFLNNFFKK